MSKYVRKTNRPYRLVTESTAARFKAAVIAHGNGSAAVRTIEPDEHDAGRRAWLINRKSKQFEAAEYIDHQMQQGAVEAIERVRLMVQSSDEKIATKNAHFVIDHVRGKPLQRSESKHLTLNIDTLFS